MMSFARGGRIAVLLVAIVTAAAVDTAIAGMRRPVLQFIGAQKYAAAGVVWVRYELSVANRNDFDQRLFEATPSIPACYASTTAAMVFVYDLANPSHPLHSFCPRNRNELGAFWFSVREGDYGTGRIWIEVLDRRTNQKVASNAVRIYDGPSPPRRTCPRRHVPSARTEVVAEVEALI